MLSVTKNPGVSSILLFSGSGINFPRPLYSLSVGNKRFKGAREEITSAGTIVQVAETRDIKELKRK